MYCCLVPAVRSFALVRQGKNASSRRGGGSPWALELILFAVQRSFERYGVARRLQKALFEFCEQEAIPKMVVLSAELVGQKRNWWCTAGGLNPATASSAAANDDDEEDSDEDDEDEGCVAFTNFSALRAHLGSHDVPDSFILPWDMHASGKDERRARNQAINKAMELKLTDEDATAKSVRPDVLARCGFKNITILVADVQGWLRNHGERSVRGGSGGGAGSSGVGSSGGANDGDDADEEEEEEEDDDDDDDEEEEAADDAEEEIDALKALNEALGSQDEEPNPSS